MGLGSCCCCSNSGPLALQCSWTKGDGGEAGASSGLTALAVQVAFATPLSHQMLFAALVQAGLPSGSEPVAVGRAGPNALHLLRGSKVASGRIWARTARAHSGFLGILWCSSCPWGTKGR